jgi:hypothetical protein
MQSAAMCMLDKQSFFFILAFQLEAKITKLIIFCGRVAHQLNAASRILTEKFRDWRQGE